VQVDTQIQEMVVVVEVLLLLDAMGMEERVQVAKVEPGTMEQHMPVEAEVEMVQQLIPLLVVERVEEEMVQQRTEHLVIRWQVELQLPELPIQVVVEVEVLQVEHKVDKMVVQE
jgi:hypothetical protein